ncbi:MAG: hypothetical protein PHG96_07055 [Kiritimatiellae bacterium]|nr:hypothetical protein [Kiritimatiellia bacterium]
MNYAEQLQANHYLYILRRTIPPWNWRSNLDELKEMCRKYRIDEVCVKIDTGTFTHYFPDEKWLLDYQQVLFAVRDELAAVGVNYSLNPNVTQGHGDRGRHIDRLHPDWPMITGADGTHATDCACNSSPGWRAYFRRQWTIYAETRPAVIWIEDDVRTFGHGPVGQGCFCTEHIRRFNEKYGTAYSREEIYARVMAPGAPDPLRGQWIGLLGEITAEMVQLAEETVHAVSPETVIGLMSSGPGSHATEGRDWQLLHRKMSGPEGRPVASRPPLSNYRENHLSGMIYTADQCRLTRRAFDGLPTLEEGEIENYPYTGYTKSNTFLRLQNSTAIGSGCAALTLNLFDHCGTPMAATEDILRTLNAEKDYLAALKKRLQPVGRNRGIGLYYHPDSARFKELGDSCNARGLNGETLNAAELLEMLGFAITFEPAPVTVLTGQDIRCAGSTEIERLLGSAVLVDATAFITLSEMGYGELLGGRLLESFQLNTTYPLAGEHFHCAGFGGKAGQFFSLAIHRQTPRFAAIEADRDAVEITEFVDPDLKRLFGGCYAYTNRLGGRIVVLPLEFGGLGHGFADPGRKVMMLEIFRWLSRDRIPLYLSGDRKVLPLRFDHPSYTVCGLYNLSLDELADVTAELCIDRPVEAVERLDPNGNWRRFVEFRHEGSHFQAMLSGFKFQEPVYLTIYTQSE